WRRAVDGLRAVFVPTDDREFDAEVDEHLRLLSERYIRRGLTPQDAVAAARRQFGNMTRLREDRHGLLTNQALEALWIDIRYAARRLRKTYTFTAAVALTLALGIGANTAIFSLCDAVLLKPLPYADPNRLVTLWEQLPNGTTMTVAPANFVDWRRQTHSFSEVAAIRSSSLVLTASGEPARLSVGMVSWDFFALFGVESALGRSFFEDEDQPGRDHVAILSYATWASRFGSRTDLIGSRAMLNDAPYTIVGVLPKDFTYAGKGSVRPHADMYDLWVPLALDPARLQRGTHPLRVFARLASNVDLRTAQAELDVLGAALARAYPDDDKDRTI